MNLVQKSIVAGLLATASLTIAAQAQATVLSGTLTTDNGFFAYLSTSDSTLGSDFLASSTYWPTAVSFSKVLPAAPVLYLHIEGIQTGIVEMITGQFSLSGTKYEFANGTQSLLTNTTDWKGSYVNGSKTFTIQPWVTPTGAVLSYGLNVNSTPLWHHIAGISSAAEDIWPVDNAGCQKCTVDISTPIYLTPLPEPAEWAMIITGLGMVGATARFGRRRQAVAI